MAFDSNRVAHPPFISAYPATMKSEEIFNTITHGIGLVLSVAGFVLAVRLATSTGDPWVVASMTIYGLTLILLYTTSTLYHAFAPGRWKNRLRRCDHAAIFLLIAGTYTPFMLVNLRGMLSWSMLGAVWAVAAAGVGFKFFFTGRFEVVSSLLYLVHGWMIVAALKPLAATLPPGGLTLLVAGGLCYTGGMVFYLWRGLRFHHAIWHLFVLAGSVLHYFAVLKSVA